MVQFFNVMHNNIIVILHIIDSIVQRKKKSLVYRTQHMQGGLVITTLLYKYAYGTTLFTIITVVHKISKSHNS